ncbi:hypothetical protein D9615_002944 [Tricholomella constricta]|uniref:Uncharacterized protein n=1 Tax=Tricholomella constricta TaxID=117010 RepID=A0A8H5HG97_9AGAR|nr:hypothetical protein D9615_002944 [Tricholomella constricta]
MIELPYAIARFHSEFLLIIHLRLESALGDVQPTFHARRQRPPRPSPRCTSSTTTSNPSILPPSTMSVNHSSIPQSLPSFAQAFSTQSLGSISSGNNSLPPIQTRFPPMEHRRVTTPSRPPSEDNPNKIPSRKRSRNDVTSAARDDDRHSSDASPRLVHIKEEQDQVMLESTPPPPPPPARTNSQHLVIDTAGAPPPSSLRPSPSKKRRVTISGAPHPLNTDVRVPVDQTNSTPISPVVMGFTIKRDNPSAIEQVKSMITVKQKQKALIEQRRGSVVGTMSPSTITTNPPIPLTPADERNLPSSSKSSAPTRPLRRSPNNGSSTRRLATNPSHGSSNPRPPSPSPIIVPSQQPAPPAPNQVVNSNSLPPPPISFARRRAEQLGSGKKKPADILISPREAQTQEQFQPAIQSAPPVPHAGQGSFFSGRFPMTLPRLPSVMGGGDNIRRVATNVPPTPTRLSMQRNAPSAVAQPVAGISGRSPPAASVPIASTLVPPTPGFHHPGYAGDKAAFLTPFEVFYDALNDSKQLKGWLGEQLQRSNAMMQALTQQQEKLSEVVESLVEKRVAGMRSEMAGLHRRVEELEDALRIATTSGRRQSITGSKHSGNKTPLRNGITSGPMASESYTFPPVPPSSSSSSHDTSSSSRRRPESGWGQDPRENASLVEPESGSPAPAHFDSMRMSVSASRLDPPRSHPHPLEPPQLPQARSSPRAPFGGVQSPPHAAMSSPGMHGKSLADRPSLSRQSSAHGPSSGEGGQQQAGQSPPVRRAESRRNSIIMSPPEAPGDDG